MIRHTPFEVQVERNGAEARVVPAGELDLATAPRLESEVRAAAAAAKEVVLDLSGLTFIDSSGLRILILLYERSQAEGWVLAMVAPAGEARAIFRISGVDKHLPFVGG